MIAGRRASEGRAVEGRGVWMKANKKNKRKREQRQANDSGMPTGGGGNAAVDEIMRSCVAHSDVHQRTVVAGLRGCETATFVFSCRCSKPVAAGWNDLFP